MKKQICFAKDVETRFCTWNYSLDRLLSKGKTKKSHWINDGWIKWKVMAKFVGLRAKTYGYLIDDISEDKKS